MERDANETIANAYITISTHTLTWSVTLVGKFGGEIQLNFNSHAHVERDFHLPLFCMNITGISTHTLTWSVTHTL